MDVENTARKQCGRPFAPGQSGNPRGKPKGARNRATLAAESLLEGEASALTRKVIDVALAGDTAALRLCLERIMPPRKDRVVRLALPRIESAEDAREAAKAVLEAVAAGEITVAEGRDALLLVESCGRAIAPEVKPQVPAANVVVRFVTASDQV